MVDESKYADAFALIDANGDGTITAGELVRLMQALGDEVTPDAAHQAVELMDQDGDGEISLEEFASYLATRAPASS